MMLLYFQRQQQLKSQVATVEPFSNPPWQQQESGSVFGSNHNWIKGAVAGGWKGIHVQDRHQNTDYFAPILSLLPLSSQTLIGTLSQRALIITSARWHLLLTFIDLSS